MAAQGKYNTSSRRFLCGSVQCEASQPATRLFRSRPTPPDSRSWAHWGRTGTGSSS